jgi:hypothetical protein
VNSVTPEPPVVPAESLPAAPPGAPASAPTSDEQSLEFLTSHVRESKQHKKICSELGIKDIEDMCFSILSFHSTPGDISKELVKEKEKALKRKVKRLRLQLQQMAMTHEMAG